MKKALIALLAVLLIPVSHEVFSYRSYNIVLITVDALRTDYLSCYNREATQTPGIDLLAHRGVLFENAYSLMPETMPSHVSILSSRQPYKMNLFKDGDTFDQQAPLISDLLGKKGYHTAAFVSLETLKKSFGLFTGFNQYADDFNMPNKRSYKFASEINAELFPWLQKEKDNPFFVWVHYSDPQDFFFAPDETDDTSVLVNGVETAKFCLAKREKLSLTFLAHPGQNKITFSAIVKSGPKKIQQQESTRYLSRDVTFTAPETGISLEYGNEWSETALATGATSRSWQGDAVLRVVNENPDPVPVRLRFEGGSPLRTQEMLSNYAARVAVVDKQIGLLLQKLDQWGLQKNTIVVLTAGSGEGLKSHVEIGNENLYQEIIHVPLIIDYPLLGYSAKRTKAMVNHLDIMPTILDMLHVKNRETMEGRSLKHAISWSPVDWLLSSQTGRENTFAFTFDSENRINSCSIVQGRLKLIYSPAKEKWEAYDLSIDQTERNNLVKTDHARFEKLTSLRGALQEQRRGITTESQSH